MLSWRETEKSTRYQNALSAVDSLGKPAEGFLVAAEANKSSGHVLTNLIKQNNLLIQLLCSVKVDTEQILHLLRQKSDLIPIDPGLSQQLEVLTSKLSSLHLTTPVEKKAPAKLFYYTDPRQIFAREKAKLTKP